MYPLLPAPRAHFSTLPSNPLLGTPLLIYVLELGKWKLDLPYKTRKNSKGKKKKAWM